VKVTVPAGAVTLPLTVWEMVAPETRATVLEARVLVSGLGEPPLTPMLKTALVAVTEVRFIPCAAVTRSSGSVAVKLKLVANGAPAVAAAGTVVGWMSMASWG
jgi:hypothetical protein